jgi:hypothetical protein
MPKKKTAAVKAKITPVAEVVEVIKPKKHIVMIKVTKRLPNIPVPIEFPVGEIRYWESTDDITYSYEAGYQQYMDSFVNRAIQIEKNTWVPRESTRKWLENLPKAMLIDGYSVSDVLTLDEVE